MKIRLLVEDAAHGEIDAGVHQSCATLLDVVHCERLGKDYQNAHLEPLSKNRARI